MQNHINAWALLALSYLAMSPIAILSWIFVGPGFAFWFIIVPALAAIPYALWWMWRDRTFIRRQVDARRRRDALRESEFRD